MPGRVNPGFLFQKLAVSVKFKASFQNKMAGCALEVNEGDLCLYGVLGLPLKNKEPVKTCQ